MRQQKRDRSTVTYGRTGGGRSSTPLPAGQPLPGGQGGTPLPIPSVRPHNRGWSRDVFAALDLGTNNCRLLIARPAAADGFLVVDAFSRVVRLGEGLHTTGRLSDGAIQRAVDALHVCADKLQRRRVTLARSVATEACRQAANGPDFIARVAEETGIHLQVIGAAEEARLAVLGCQALIAAESERALIFDIGGGSTEIVLVRCREDGPSVIDWTSTPWGVVSLSEAEPEVTSGATAADRLAAFDRMRARLFSALAPFRARIGEDGAARAQLIGTSGTVTTLASVWLKLTSYDRRQVDGQVVPAEALRDIGRSLAAMSLDERQRVPCIGADRAELVVAGCAILDVILECWPAEHLSVADRGIREGILRALLAGATNP